MTHNSFLKTYEVTMSRTRESILKYNWENKSFYTNWVGQIYHFLTQSTRMIPFAASQFKVEDEAFFNRCIDHSNEERGHHTMAINDLKNLGSTINAHALLWPTEQLYAYPFRVIEHVDPIAIFGISAYMEGLSVTVGQEITEKVIRHFGKKSACFLTSHTNDDEQHIADALGVLSKCSPERQLVVERVFLASNNNFLTMLDAINDISFSKQNDGKTQNLFSA